MRDLWLDQVSGFNFHRPGAGIVGVPSHTRAPPKRKSTLSSSSSAKVSRSTAPVLTPESTSATSSSPSRASSRLTSREELADRESAAAVGIARLRGLLVQSDAEIERLARERAKGPITFENYRRSHVLEGMTSLSDEEVNEFVEIIRPIFESKGTVPGDILSDYSWHDFVVWAFNFGKTFGN